MSDANEDFGKSNLTSLLNRAKLNMLQNRAQPNPSALPEHIQNIPSEQGSVDYSVESEEGYLLEQLNDIKRLFRTQDMFIEKFQEKSESSCRDKETTANGGREHESSRCSDMFINILEGSFSSIEGSDQASYSERSKGSPADDSLYFSIKYFKRPSKLFFIEKIVLKSHVSLLRL